MPFFKSLAINTGQSATGKPATTPGKSLVIIKTAVKNPNKINSVEELNSYDVKAVEETPLVEETTETVEN